MEPASPMLYLIAGGTLSWLLQRLGGKVDRGWERGEAQLSSVPSLVADTRNNSRMLELLIDNDKRVERTLDSHSKMMQEGLEHLERRVEHVEEQVEMLRKRRMSRLGHEMGCFEPPGVVPPKPQV